jgi:hypothetical protein
VGLRDSRASDRTVQRVVFDAHAIADTHVGLFGAIESSNRAVALLNGHAIELADRWRRLVLLDGVSNQGAADDRPGAYETFRRQVPALIAIEGV